jgi:hypothetical protein
VVNRLKNRTISISNKFINTNHVHKHSINCKPLNSRIIFFQYHLFHPYFQNPYLCSWLVVSTNCVFCGTNTVIQTFNLMPFKNTHVTTQTMRTIWVLWRWTLVDWCICNFRSRPHIILLDSYRMPCWQIAAITEQLIGYSSCNVAELEQLAGFCDLQLTTLAEWYEQ